jgi:hypothetical protein
VADVTVGTEMIGRGEARELGSSISLPHRRPPPSRGPRQPGRDSPRRREHSRRRRQPARLFPRLHPIPPSSGGCPAARVPRRLQTASGIHDRRGSHRPRLARSREPDPSWISSF